MLKYRVLIEAEQTCVSHKRLDVECHEAVNSRQVAFKMVRIRNDCAWQKDSKLKL